MLLEHLSRFAGPGQAPACPVCGNQIWSAEGIVAQQVYTQQPGMFFTAGGRAAPMVQLVCTTCFYVMFFAWAPLKAAYGR